MAFLASFTRKAIHALALQPAFPFPFNSANVFTNMGRVREKIKCGYAVARMLSQTAEGHVFGLSIHFYFHSQPIQRHS